MDQYNERLGLKEYPSHRSAWEGRTKKEMGCIQPSLVMFIFLNHRD